MRPMYQAAKEKQTSKILLPLLSTWKKGTNHKWGGKGVTRQNGSYETKTKTIIKTNMTIDTETKQIWKKKPATNGEAEVSILISVQDREGA